MQVAVFLSWSMWNFFERNVDTFEMRLKQQFRSHKMRCFCSKRAGNMKLSDICIILGSTGCIIRCCTDSLDIDDRAGDSTHLNFKTEIVLRRRFLWNQYPSFLGLGLYTAASDTRQFSRPKIWLLPTTIEAYTIVVTSIFVKLWFIITTAF